MRPDGSGLTGRRLLIISIIFILVVGGIFFAFTNGSRRTQTPVKEINVSEVLANRSIRMTVDGKVVANEDHNSYRIEIGIDKRNIEVFKGYDLTIAGSKTYTNNRRAYTDLVHALRDVGFDRERRVSDEEADERGACATGNRFYFEVLDNGRSVRRLWTSTCGEYKGTLNASGNAIKLLFDKQIPDLQEQLKPLTAKPAAPTAPPTAN